MQSFVFECSECETEWSERTDTPSLSAIAHTFVDHADDPELNPAEIVSYEWVAGDPEPAQYEKQPAPDLGPDQQRMQSMLDTSKPLPF